MTALRQRVQVPNQEVLGDVGSAFVRREACLSGGLGISFGPSLAAGPVTVGSYHSPFLGHTNFTVMESYRSYAQE